jgi:hypothetical protein
MFLDKDRTMDNAKKHKICNEFRVFDNRELRVITTLVLRGSKQCRNGENCVLRSFIFRSIHKILLG